MVTEQINQIKKEVKRVKRIVRRCAKSMFNDKENIRKNAYNKMCFHYESLLIYAGFTFTLEPLHNRIIELIEFCREKGQEIEDKYPTIFES